MPKAVRFQDPGEGIHEAEVVEVLVSPGEEVKEGQQLLVVETDKANFEIESPLAGVVEKVRVEVGDSIEVGQTLVTLRSGDGAAAEEEPAEAAPEPAEGEREEAEEPGPAEAEREEAEEPGPAEAERERVREARRGDGAEAQGPVPASPATRRIARDLGVDLREVRASGEDGRVLAGDVRAHAAQGFGRGARAPRHPPSQRLPDFSRFGPVERSPLRSVRRTIARRMARAWQSIPHVTHDDVADITELDAFRRRQAERLKRATGGGLTLTALVLKATAAVLREYPRFNASLDAEAEELVYKRYYHLGVAMDSARGLLVPTLRDVDRKSVRELARELQELARRARDGLLTRAEMEGGTFTVTNAGVIGGTHFTPIINHPQVAILGLGRARYEARPRGAPERSEIAARLVLPLSLAFDHRVNDGADAARFANRLIELLEDPEWFAVMV